MFIQREEFIPSLFTPSLFTPSLFTPCLPAAYPFPIRLTIPFFDRFTGVTCAFTAGLL